MRREKYSRSKVAIAWPFKYGEKRAFARVETLHGVFLRIVVNRLQGALLEEAFKLIGTGIVLATDLDKAVFHGLGLRWSFMGPMQTIHLNARGEVTQYVERYGQMYRDFGLSPYYTLDWHKVTDEKLEAELGHKTSVADVPATQNDRERKLMALLRHKAQAAV